MSLQNGAYNSQGANRQYQSNNQAENEGDDRQQQQQGAIRQNQQQDPNQDRAGRHLTSDERRERGHAERKKNNRRADRCIRCNTIGHKWKGCLAPCLHCHENAHPGKPCPRAQSLFHRQGGGRMMEQRAKVEQRLERRRLNQDDNAHSQSGYGNHYESRAPSPASTSYRPLNNTNQGGLGFGHSSGGYDQGRGFFSPTSPLPGQGQPRSYGQGYHQPNDSTFNQQYNSMPALHDPRVYTLQSRVDSLSLQINELQNSSLTRPAPSNDNMAALASARKLEEQISRLQKQKAELEARAAEGEARATELETKLEETTKHHEATRQKLGNKRQEIKELRAENMKLMGEDLVLAKQSKVTNDRYAVAAKKLAMYEQKYGLLPDAEALDDGQSLAEEEEPTQEQDEGEHRHNEQDKGEQRHHQVDTNDYSSKGGGVSLYGLDNKRGEWGDEPYEGPRNYGQPDDTFSYNSRAQGYGGQPQLSCNYPANNQQVNDPRVVSRGGFRADMARLARSMYRQGRSDEEINEHILGQFEKEGKQLPCSPGDFTWRRLGGHNFL